MGNVGALLRHYGFHLLVLLTGGGVVALQRYLEPGTWVVLVMVYVAAAVVGLVALIRHERTEREAADVPDVAAELDALPVGIEVTHVPGRVPAPQGGATGPGDWRYRWFFKTVVRAQDRPLTITAFGALGWDGGRWVLSSGASGLNTALFTAQEFAEWYACPAARLEPGALAVDSSNWAASNTTTSFRQKWFYIAEDAAGTVFKGEAVVELLAPARDSI